MSHQRLKRLLPFLAWTPLLKDKQVWWDDLIAGLTGAIIVLPQGVAFAVIAGMPPEYGLYAAMVPAIIAALFGSSFHLVSGPTTTGSIMLFTFLSKYHPAESIEYIQLALTLTFLVGVTKILFGIFKLGNLISFVSSAVIVGYTAGAAFLIAFKQLKFFTGVPIPRGIPFYEVIVVFFQKMDQTNFYILVVSMVTLISGILVKKYFKKIPYMIVSMVLGTIVAYFINEKFGQGSTGIQTVGAIPATLPPLSSPVFDMETIRLLIPGVLAATILTLTEAVSIARSISLRSGQQLNINQEFIGQGLSNIAGSFTSGYMSTGSFNRSGANYEANARTPLSAILAGIFLIGIVVLVAPLAAYLPNATMAAVLFLVAYGIIDFTQIKQIFKTSKSEAIVTLVTFVATLTIDIEYAILTGVMASFAFYLMKTSQPKITERTPNQSDSRRKFTDVESSEDFECPQVKFMRIDGSIYFGATGHISSYLSELTSGNSDLKHVVLFANAINFLDSAGVDMLSRFSIDFHKQGGKFYLYKVKPSVQDILEKGGVISDGIYFDSKGEIISALIPQMNQSVCETCHKRIFNECSTLAGAKNKSS